MHFFGFVRPNDSPVERHGQLVSELKELKHVLEDAKTHPNSLVVIDEAARSTMDGISSSIIKAFLWKFARETKALLIIVDQSPGVHTFAAEHPNLFSLAHIDQKRVLPGPQKDVGTMYEEVAKMVGDIFNDPEMADKIRHDGTAAEKR
jgi:hypothetical protein